jgi:spore coat polysaccharide biosynthesis predicted glycosyltransferase SpsG
VVVGRAFAHHAELAAAAAAARRAVRVLHDVSDMASLLADCDVAISGGGVTLFELCCVGVPTVALTAEPRELATIARFADGAAVGLGLWTPAEADALRAEVARLLADEGLRRRLSAAARERVDGEGLERFLDEVGLPGARAGASGTTHPLNAGQTGCFGRRAPGRLPSTGPQWYPRRLAGE